MQHLLILKNVKKIYTEKTYIHRTWNTEILKGVNLTLNQGEFASILGKSLSGKSTLTGIISGRLPFTEGEMWVNGIFVNKLVGEEHQKFFNKNVGVIYDTFAPYNHITDSTQELIKQAIYQSPVVEEKEVESQIQKWLHYVDFVGEPNLSLSKLHYIERRKAVFAASFASMPMLIIVDEPTNHFTADFIFPLLERYNREFNTSIIFLTQIESEAERALRRFRLCDGVLEEVR